jgi:DNA polymerase III delta prime subunit
MAPISYTSILEREAIASQIKDILNNFDTQHNNPNYKKGIYIYGSSGCGKTHFINEILKSMDYDIIKYDAGDVRNRALIDTITSNNVSNCNVLQMMSRKIKKIAIVMDEIDGMNNGDKGGINALIKLIRQKKTKKQKLENATMNPIICIGNYYVDKKIKELIKVCNAFELKPPTSEQTKKILDIHIPEISNELKTTILDYIQGDFRKYDFIHSMYQKTPHLLTEQTLKTIFQTKSYNDDAKHITHDLFNHSAPIHMHNILMNDTDRTIVGLLWHENIADILEKVPIHERYPFYLKILDNICYADYIDRITFQNQIWLFNEMSSLLKTWNNNRLYHEQFPDHKGKYTPNEIRFTKVLTKYSTEYNNILFIYGMTQQLDMDKKDLIAFFQEMRYFFALHEDHFTPSIMSNKSKAAISAKSWEKEKTEWIESQMEQIFENCEISKLDIRRMYRYLDKNVKKDAIVLSMENEDDDDTEED